MSTAKAHCSHDAAQESTTFKTPGPGRASYSAGDISEPSLSPIELSSDSDEEEDLSLLTAHGNQPQVRPQGRQASILAQSHLGSLKSTGHADLTRLPGPCIQVRTYVKQVLGAAG